MAELVMEDERYPWPTADAQRVPGSPSTSEVVAAYGHRADVPPERWWGLLVDARRQIDLLAYAMQFLPEAHPRLFDLLRGKAAAGCKIRIALVDPGSRQVAERDAEEGLDGGLIARVRTSLHYFGELADCEGTELRLHATPMYNSLFRFDDELFVTVMLPVVPVWAWDRVGVGRESGSDRNRPSSAMIPVAFVAAWHGRLTPGSASGPLVTGRRGCAFAAKCPQAAGTGLAHHIAGLIRSLSDHQGRDPHSPAAR